MLTYVINTSENKTFDSDQLFDLAGYNKIRWLNCSLNEIKLCAQHIYEKQNVLGAEAFRIAVIVDFYSFDRVRVPYGKHGFRPETGVDISLYMPYIEMFLLDNLVLYLEQQELRAEDFEVYYIQHSRLEHYDFLDNAVPQLHYIMEGSSLTEDEQQAHQALPAEQTPHVVEQKRKRLTQDREKEDVIPPEDLIPYPAFTLYCTPSVSLRFRLYDYPYGAEEMTFPEFYRAVRERMSCSNGTRCHYYVTNYGGGKARAAFDALSLSLYLIRTYEREEKSPEQGDLTITALNTNVLKNVLETSWNKVNVARTIAKANNSQYYALEPNMGVVTYAPEDDAEQDTFIPRPPEKEKTTEALYDKICYYHDRTPAQAAADNREEFNRIMDKYLLLRDGTRATNVSSEFETMMQEGTLATTTQCPSKEEYLHIVKKKQQQISEIFDKALSAEMIEVDYSEEKKKADEVFRKHEEAKALLHKNIIGDIIFLLLSLVVVLGPYALLQLTGYNLKTPEIALLAVYTAALFSGIFVLAVILQMLPLAWKLKRLKTEMRLYYNQCYQKERHSMSQIRDRYHQDLIQIERARYEMRQLKHLFDANLAKETNVKRHRDMLDAVETRLSSLLNCLDVEPKIDHTESVSGEFNILKPIRARENKIYRIFSIEIIEQLFSKKGRDEQC